MDRRTFLKTGLTHGALGAAALGGLAVPSARAEAADATLLEVSTRPTNYEAPRSTFVTRVTPTERFYIRNHFDTPTVDAATWRLKVGGLVEQPVELTLADLQAMPQTTVEAVLQCSGNGRALFTPRLPGLQWQRGAVGNAEWTGVRLKDVLARAKVKAGAGPHWHVQVQGAERPVMPKTPAFIRGLPLDKARHDDTLIALQMNGKPLSREHGFPARVVAPGWVADDWVKWLVDLQVIDGEPKGFFYETAYRFPKKPGAPGEAVAPEDMATMTVMNVKTIIGSHGEGPAKAGPQEIVGVAWSGGGAAVTKVELSIDGGPWAQATLEGAPSKYGFRVFRHPWTAAAGRHTLRARATDATGAVQPEFPVWNPSGYLHNAIDPVVVEVMA